MNVEKGIKNWGDRTLQAEKRAMHGFFFFFLRNPSCFLCVCFSRKRKWLKSPGEGNPGADTTVL